MSLLFFQLVGSTVTYMVVLMQYKDPTSDEQILKMSGLTVNSSTASTLTSTVSPRVS